MKTVIYRSACPLSCACDIDVVVCVADTVVTVTGAPFIDAHLDSIESSCTVDACGAQSRIYYYSLSYGTVDDPETGEVQQLTDPTYQILTSEVNGVICDQCLLTYIDYVAGQPR